MKYIESIFLSNTCKIVLLLLIIISFAVFISPRVVNAENIEDYQTITLRAGGGGSSTGSSSSGSSSGHHTSGTRSYGTGGVISNILSAILMVILLCIGTIKINAITKTIILLLNSLSILFILITFLFIL